MVLVIIVDSGIAVGGGELGGSREFGNIVSLLERLELDRVSHGGGTKSGGRADA